MGYLRSTRRHLEEMAFMLNFSDDLVKKKKKKNRQKVFTWRNEN